MTSLRLNLISFALLACIALLLSALGCNTGTMTAPDPELSGIVFDPNFIRILSTPEGEPRAARIEDSASIVSAEFGGIVSNGWVTLEFPPGALSEDTEITISMREPDKLIVELGPHGIHFNKPVIITFDLTGTDAEGNAQRTATIWLNEEHGWWETIQSLPSLDANKAQTTLQHFSHYAQIPQG